MKKIQIDNFNDSVYLNGSDRVGKRLKDTIEIIKHAGFKVSEIYSGEVDTIIRSIVGRKHSGFGLAGRISELFTLKIPKRLLSDDLDLNSFKVTPQIKEITIKAILCIMYRRPKIFTFKYNVENFLVNFINSKHGYKIFIAMLRDEHYNSVLSKLLRKEYILKHVKELQNADNADFKFILNQYENIKDYNIKRKIWTSITEIEFSITDYGYLDAKIILDDKKLGRYSFSIIDKPAASGPGFTREAIPALISNMSNKQFKNCLKLNSGIFEAMAKKEFSFLNISSHIYKLIGNDYLEESKLNTLFEFLKGHNSEFLYLIFLNCVNTTVNFGHRTVNFQVSYDLKNYFEEKTDKLFLQTIGAIDAAQEKSILPMKKEIIERCVKIVSDTINKIKINALCNYDNRIFPIFKSDLNHWNIEILKNVKKEDIEALLKIIPITPQWIDKFKKFIPDKKYLLKNIYSRFKEINVETYKEDLNHRNQVDSIVMVWDNVVKTGLDFEYHMDILKEEKLIAANLIAIIDNYGDYTWTLKQHKKRIEIIKDLLPSNSLEKIKKNAAVNTALSFL